MKIFSKRTLTWFDYTLIVGVVAANVVYAALSGEIDIVGSVAGIAGVIGVVLSARQSILNYLFGLINVALYAYIAFHSQFYGSSALYAFYYLPMQFVGWVLWRRHAQAEDASKVVARRMSALQRLLLAVVCAVAIAATGYMLGRFSDDPQPYRDAAVAVFSIIAQYLMVKAFAEQWWLWIAINVVCLVMWIVSVAQGEPHAVVMVVMWAFYLANSVNGLIQWQRNSSAKQQ